MPGHGSSEDRKKASWQLGRSVIGDFSIIARCRFHNPLAILNDPLPVGLGGPVFSTPWWLTCPQLQVDLSRLEGENYLQKITPPAKTYQDKAVKKRLQLLGRRRLSDLERRHPQLLKAFQTRGIAGEQGTNLKCLHAHYAFYLLYSCYPAGEEIAALLPGKPEDRCANYCGRNQVGIDP